MKFLLTVLLTVSVIPLPNSVVERNGSFQLDEKTAVVSTCAEFEQTADDFCEDISLPTGYDLPRSRRLFGKAVLLKMDRSIVPEGYTLDVRSRKVVIKASDAAGAFYGLQTLRQLMPAEIYGKVKSETPWKAQCCTIKDAPGVGYRGMLLDCGRYFYPKEAVLKFIDMMAMHKMNNLQWHLTEDQGWRIEIKKYPELLEKGAQRVEADGSIHKGYYTQEEVKDVVAYAAARHITVVPEIDLPGHAEAALNAYPSLTCSGQAPRVPETGFTDALFCAGRDSVLLFLYDVLDEVCDLFPSPYIHLGGDEAPKGQWNRCPACQQRIADEGLRDSHDLQRWLSAQMARHLEQRGRHAIFWEDILYSDGTPLPDGTAVQWWNYRGHRDRGLREAIRQGLPVVASPNYYCYLNFPEAPWRGYGPDRTFTYADAAQRNPADAALTDHPDALLGMEAALWTDYNLTEDLLLPRLLPRLYPLAHQMWAH